MQRLLDGQGCNCIYKRRDLASRNAWFSISSIFTFLTKVFIYLQEGLAIAKICLQSYMEYLTHTCWKIHFASFSPRPPPPLFFDLPTMYEWRFPPDAYSITIAISVAVRNTCQSASHLPLSSKLLMQPIAGCSLRL